MDGCVQLEKRPLQRWARVHLDRRAIELTKTKNGSDRTVDLNVDAIAAIESLKRPGQKAGDRVFPREGVTFSTRSWFKPCLEEAKITGYLWHCNRRTFYSWLAMAGASTKDIQWPQATRASRWLHAIAICLLNIRRPLWN